MKDEMFNELLESVKQAGDIRKGKRNPSRHTVIEEPDVAAIREKYDMTQQEFSSFFGISVGTLRNWEPGRRKAARTCKSAFENCRKETESNFGIFIVNCSANNNGFKRLKTAW